MSKMGFGGGDGRKHISAAVNALLLQAYDGRMMSVHTKKISSDAADQKGLANAVPCLQPRFRFLH